MTNETFELFDLWRRQAAFAGGFASLAPAAGFVMATRLARLAVEGSAPSAGGLREAERMVSEKMVAAVEGGAAAARVLTGLVTAASPLAAAGVMMSAGEAAMKPAARRVKANARRLARP
ncbi:hypothetical protein [Chenggangzhangella methanolivorans]|uniref:Uncharacterized protein n=1 Tax=Chenggangzhangella methanolivorans TaxID=1437009 RepID=A0A9E6R808_9HYPH|nr:hypothetical protein [Chenggangzhangella methanolivorans]QZN98332.1 hypothetical protein K6K41_14495 [Chenggangzhangella methanolivorans]